MWAIIRSLEGRVVVWVEVRRQDLRLLVLHSAANLPCSVRWTCQPRVEVVDDEKWLYTRNSFPSFFLYLFSKLMWYVKSQYLLCYPFRTAQTTRLKHRPFLKNKINCCMKSCWSILISKENREFNSIYLKPRQLKEDLCILHLIIITAFEKRYDR